MAPSVLCVGSATTNVVGAVPRYPVRIGDRQELSAFSMQGGGTAANVAAALATLGAKVRFGGALADDFLGNWAAESLVEAGVDVSLLRRRDGGVSPFAFFVLDGESKRRTSFFTRGSFADLAPGEIPTAALAKVDLLIIDGAFPEAQLGLAIAARDQGKKTLLCAHALAPGMAQLVSVCDAVVANERFAREISSAVPRSLSELLSLGAQCAVVTLGEDGAAGQETGQESIRVEASRSDVVDATGAGDLFRAAFAYSWLEGASLRDRMRFACAAAAIGCESYGPREGLPDAAEVRSRLR